MLRISKSLALRALVGGAAMLSLAACGGGGGGVNSASSNPSGSSGSSGATTTPVINYDDAEYQRSSAAVDSGALTAYKAGASGAGVMLAVVDTGIATVGTEFAGRVSSLSRDFNNTGSYVDTEGHGTAVSAVAAAGRNGSDILGVAFGATILALRADTPGTCTTNGCSFSTNTLAMAVDYATTSGAKVVNMSLGGAPSTANLTNAINRATAAGVIIVISAGNDSAAEPDQLARIASSTAAHGLVIIAGSHDLGGAASSFSNKAGSYGQYYLSALGSEVRAFDHTGTDYIYSGTSFSAPIVAAAATLLTQAFPNLTPAQVVALLYSSATDAGTAGVDATYGRGLLNLNKAFQPQGTTALAGSQIAVTDADQTTTSAAMGDAVAGTTSLGRVVVLDTLGRAYTTEASTRIAHETALRPLQTGIAANLKTINKTVGRLSLTSTLARGWADDPAVGLALGRRGAAQLVQARPLSGVATLMINRDTRSAIAFATQGQTLDTQLSADAPVGSYLVARGPGETPGFSRQAGMSFALAHRMGTTSITAVAEQGSVSRLSLSEQRAPGYSQLGMTVRRRIGRLALGLGVSSLREQGTVLGAYLAPAMGRSGATTRYVSLDARLGIGGGWSLAAAWRQGWTRTDAGGVLQHSVVASRTAAADLSRSGRGSRFGLRLALPPRVNGGGFNLLLPTAYDYATGAIDFTPTRIGLTPRGQETDVEASYGLNFGGGWIDTNLYWRRQPANFVTAPDDLGMALRYSLSF